MTFNALHGYDMQWPVLVCMLLNELSSSLFLCLSVPPEDSYTEGGYIDVIVILHSC